MLELDDVHGDSEMVHVSVFTPTESPVTVVVGFVASVKLTPAGPDHSPAPTVGVFAAIVTSRMQVYTWSAPATLVVTEPRITATSENNTGHVSPTEVHRNTFSPGPMPVTLVVAKFALTIVPPPDTSDHVPVLFKNVFVLVLNVPPVVSVLADRVAVSAHPIV